MRRVLATLPWLAAVACFSWGIYQASTADPFTAVMPFIGGFIFAGLGSLCFADARWEKFGKALRDVREPLP